MANTHFIFEEMRGMIQKLKIISGDHELDIKILDYYGKIGEFRLLWDDDWEEIQLESEMSLDTFMKYMVRNFDFIRKMRDYEVALSEKP